MLRPYPSRRRIRGRFRMTGNASKLVPQPALFARIDDGDARPAALRALMHGVDRDEHGGIADRGRRDAADRAPWNGDAMARRNRRA